MYDSLAGLNFADDAIGAKLFQAAIVYSMLFRLNDEYVFVKFAIVCLATSMARTSASCNVSCLSYARLDVSGIAKDFRRWQVTHGADGDLASGKAIRAID